MIELSCPSLVLEDAVSAPVIIQIPGESTYWDSAARMTSLSSPLQLTRLATIPMAEIKRRVLEIPAVGGYLDEYWEVDLGNEVLMIRKPRDPVADLAALGSQIPNQCFDALLAEIDKEADSGVLEDLESC